MSPTPPLLDLHALCRQFPGFELGPVALRVSPGEVHGLLGPNGAGKTTLLNLVTSQLRPTSGTLKHRGVPIRWDHPSWKRHFSYIPQTPAFYGQLTVAEMLRLAARFYGEWDERVAADLTRRFELPTHQRISTLSKGTLVKLGLVAGLGHRAELLVLDEPTAGLDPTARVVVHDALRTIASEHPSVSILLSSHLFEDHEELSTHIHILRAGRMVVEASTEALREARVFRYRAGASPPPVEPRLAGWTRNGTVWVVVPAGGAGVEAFRSHPEVIEDRPASPLAAIYHGAAHVEPH